MNLTDNYTLVNSYITLLSYNRYSVVEHTKIQALDRDSEGHWKMEREHPADDRNSTSLH